MLTNAEALLAVLVMAGVTIICRAAPFWFFRKQNRPVASRFITFVERTVPPVAMTVLACVAVLSTGKAGPTAAWPIGLATASAFLLHLWKRNALLSIGTATILYMLLLKIVV